MAAAGAEGEKKRFSYVFSYDLDFDVRVTLGALEGLELVHSYTDVLEDPYLCYQELYKGGRAELSVTCQIFSNNTPLCLPIKTASHSFTDKWAWDELVELPLKYSALPRDACLAITLWEAKRPGQAMPVAGTTVSLFTRNGQLRRGQQRLRLWVGTGADGSAETTTPGKGGEVDRMYAIYKVMKKFDRKELTRIDWLDPVTYREIQKINEEEKKKLGPVLFVDFPRFDYPVAFCEKVTELPPPPALVKELYDPEMKMDNLVEIKHMRLTRSYRRGHLGKELKPNADIRKNLNEIIRYPPTKQLTTREKDLIWKFRYYLTREKKALTFFLKCVDWRDQGEVKQATELLERWEPIDIDDALELLSSAFTNKAVRKHAVATLEKAVDSDLVLFLLQLVQALKYEDWDIDPETGEWRSALATFLVQRAVANHVLGNYLYWYLVVESQDKKIGGTQFEAMYKAVISAFLRALDATPGCEDVGRGLHLQEVLVKDIIALGSDLGNAKDRPKKIEKLRHALAAPDSLGHFELRPLPIDPTFMTGGIDPGTANIFKSAMQPLCLHFKTDLADDTTPNYVVIFKIGDDLRQDQLIIQMIKLMDQLLQREQLDLRLTPYKVLATGLDHGMVEFVHHSTPVATALSEYGSIQAFFRKHHPDPTSPYGIKTDVMDTYLRSCAGYCVITYILGIGDRHLENLMLTTQGRLFHIDFGYILGRDPKPFAPPMKLSREMVEGMGGATSGDYRKFTGYCYNAFLILRRSANLILNLFSLMTGASIQGIALEPDKAVWKVQDKFCLELSEEEAVAFFQSVINDSVSALFPHMTDQLHKYLQYWRK